MAVVYPAANGNWSNVANWLSGGAPYGQLPQSGDIVCANGFTVTIDMDLAAYTFDRLTTVATSPAAAGGGFTMGISATINANIVAGTTPCLTSTGTGTTLVINGEIKGGGAGGAYGIYCTAACTVTVTGNVTGWSGSQSFGIYCTAACTVTVTGNVTGWSGGFAYGIGCYAACTVTITGNVTGGSYSTAYGMYCSAANNIITISGAILGKTAMGVYLTNNTTGSSLTVTGVIGDGTGDTAVKIDSASTLNIIATVVASVSGYGIYAPLSTLTYRGVLTNYASRMAVVVGHMILTANTDTIWTFYDTASNYVVMASNATDISQPAQKDVRLNTLYGLASQFIGSLAVPPPATVLLGVPTDNTTGTLLMTPADFWTYGTRTLTSGGGITAAEVWDYLITSPIVPDSILELILTNLDAKVSSITSLTASDMVAILQNYDSAKQVPTNNKISDSEKNIINEIKKISTTTTVEKKRPYTW